MLYITGKKRKDYSDDFRLNVVCFLVLFHAYVQCGQLNFYES